MNREVRCLLIVFCAIAALTSCQKKSNAIRDTSLSSSNSEAIIHSFRTKVFLIDVDTQKELEAIPPFVINFQNIDSLAFENYLDNRLKAIGKENNILELSFKVSNELSIDALNNIIDMVTNAAMFDGDIVIEVKYSSKDNHWLVIPPPPF